MKHLRFGSLCLALASGLAISSCGGADSPSSGGRGGAGGTGSSAGGSGGGAVNNGGQGGSVTANGGGSGATGGGSGGGGASGGGSGGGGASGSGTGGSGAGGSAGLGGSGGGGGAGGGGTGGARDAGGMDTQRAGDAGGGALQPTFATVAGILGMSCGTGPCHNGVQHVDLRNTPGLYMRIVDAMPAAPNTMAACKTRKLVLPGQAAMSVLSRIIKAPETGCGARMPDNCSTTMAMPRRCLNAAEIAAIDGWIAAGAPM